LTLLWIIQQIIISAILYVAELRAFRRFQNNPWLRQGRPSASSASFICNFIVGSDEFNAKPRGRLTGKEECIMTSPPKSATSTTAGRARSSRWASALLLASALISASLLWPAPPALAQFTQYGNKLVGSGAVGAATQGRSVALSADGTTAIIGGWTDNSNLGAAWVFTRGGGRWNQQGAKLVGGNNAGAAAQGFSVALSNDGSTAIVGGPQDSAGLGAARAFTRSNGVWTAQAKLVGTGAVGSPQQGWSVAVSSDGNTALVGGPNDNSGDGALWVFTRSGGVWAQQGTKLVGIGAVTGGNQGYSAALSDDGNTAIVGGNSDNSNAGGAWVFTRSGGAWTQQGAKLVGSGAIGAAQQGISVALSGDGNTAMVGGSADSSLAGAAWVFTRSQNTWTQQGAKLVGSGASHSADQGISVALSGDGNTAIVGGSGDNSSVGAVWVFTRSSSVWTQQGTKRVGTGAAGIAQQGTSVALSNDGKTAAAGGQNDNSGDGAAWIFLAPGANAGLVAAHNFNGDPFSDIVWRDTSGNTAVWLMSGALVASSGNVGNVPAVWSIVGQRDFDGDGKHDLVWRDSSGNTAIWFMNGTQVASSASIGVVPTTWSIVGTGDFNGDGKGDILWRDSSGNTAIWFMNGATVASSATIGVVPTTWSIVGAGDFNGDGTSDILWRDSSGNTAIWIMIGSQVALSGSIGVVPTTWSIVGTGDFNGDGKSDLLWRDSSGNTAIWFMNGLQVSFSASIGNVPTSWSVALTGDLDGDGLSDVGWRDSSGNTAIWFMNAAQVASTASLGVISTAWIIQAANAD
jgi:hypothetical protein